MSDLSIELEAAMAALPAPWGSVLGALKAQGMLQDTMLRRIRDLGTQLERQWDETEELREEVHRLSLALVSAGIPLVDPPPLRSVS